MTKEKWNETPNVGKPLFYWLAPTRRKGMIILGILIVGFVSIQIWIQFWFAPNHLKYYLEDRQDERKQWAQDARIEPKYLSTPQLSEVLSAAYKSASDAMENTSIFSSPHPIIQEENVNLIPFEEMRKCMPILESVVPSSLSVSQQVEQDILATPPDNLLPIDNEIHLLRITLSRILQIRSEYLFLTGKKDEAFYPELRSLPLLVMCPYQDLYTYIQEIPEINLVLKKLDILIGSLSDKEKLTSAFETINRLSPYLVRDLEDDILRISLIMRLRYEKVAPSEIQAGQTVRYYIQKIAQKRFNEVHFWKCASRCWQKLISGEEFKETDFAGLAKPFDLSRAIDDYFCFLSFSNGDYTDKIAMEKDTAIRLDRIRLQIAAKLYCLENQKFPTTGADLAPKYFPSEIRNRKTGGAYRWDSSGNLIELDIKEK